MLVSIVVPMYNCGKYIDRCVESILKQTHTDLEIILVNDGSMDDTLEKGENLAQQDKRIKVYSQLNMGVAAARNFGVVVANGEYIAFVDADDYVEPDMIACLLTIADVDTLAIGDWVLNDSDDRGYLRKKEYIKVEEDFDFRFLCGDYWSDIYGGVCWKLFNLSVIKEHSIIFPSIKIGEDMLFIILYAQHIKQIRFYDKQLYHYCIYPTSAVNAIDKDFLPAIIEMHDELKHEKYRLDKKTIRAKVMDSILYEVLIKDYIFNLSKMDFINYYQKLRNTDVFISAIKSPYWNKYRSTQANLKRLMLRIVFKLNSASIVYAFIQSRKPGVRKKIRYYS